MTVRHFIIPAYLVLCILLGGSGAAGFMSNLLLQLLALPIIVAALMRQKQNSPAAARRLLWLTAAMIVVVLIQLIPLPPGVWRNLPGRESVAQGFELLGVPLPWLPISLAPDRTLPSLLFLLPAFAVLIGVIRLGAYRAPYLAWALITVSIAAILVGSLQVTGGADSPLYFYRITNWGQAVGFFANSSHMANLLLITIPFLGALYAEAISGRSRSARRSSGMVVVIATIGLIVLVGLGINQSLAGWGLAVPVIGASVLLVRYRRDPIPAWAPIAGAILTLGVVGAIFTLPLTDNPLAVSTRESTQSRATFVSVTLEKAAEYFPVGSGIGSFVDVYRTSENPQTVVNAYVNHAHSDPVEVFLETGLPGLILMLLLLAWWGARAWIVWGAGDRPDHFARAATIASAAIMAHSLVEFPLRTAAISSLFVMCLALMAQPRPAARHKRTEAENDEKPLRHMTA